MSYKNIGIYYIAYIRIKDSKLVTIHSVNLLYFIINEVDGSIECNLIDCSFTEEKNANKYLTFASTNKNKKVLETYTEL